ncbi:MAG: hypothetical protein AB1757_26665 [Acidobacteriota bacterium]
MDKIILPSITQLAGQLPILLAYLIGMILAMVFWRRYRAACRLTLIATSLLLLTSIIFPFIFQYLNYVRVERGWDYSKMSLILFMVNLLSSLLRAAGIGLLLAAVFVQRRVDTKVEQG